MLELALATVLASIVLLVTLGVFFHMERTESLLSARAKDSTELANLRLVVQRTVSNFVMSTEARPREATPRADGTTPPQPREPVVPPPPRLVLSYEQGADGLRLVTDGNGEWAAESVVPQRLEVVVADSPVPSGESDIFAKAMLQARRGKTSDKWWVRGDVQRSDEGGSGKNASGSKEANKETDASADKQPGAGDRTGDRTGDGSGASGDGVQPDPLTGEDEDAVPVRAVRGALVLRPQPLTPREARDRKTQGLVNANGEATPYACEVWWVPLPPRRSGEEAGSQLSQAGQAGEPYLVARNITYLKWTMFDDGQERQEMNATWESQLPGYVKLAVQTASGISARWTFEVDWSRGPEVPVRAAPERGLNRATPVGGNSGGSSGGSSGDGRGNSSGGGGTKRTPISKPKGDT
jgi:hypothetical protein